MEVNKKIASSKELQDLITKARGHRYLCQNVRTKKTSCDVFIVLRDRSATVTALRRQTHNHAYLTVVEAQRLVVRVHVEYRIHLLMKPHGSVSNTRARKAKQEYYSRVETGVNFSSVRFRCRRARIHWTQRDRSAVDTLSQRYRSLDRKTFYFSHSRLPIVLFSSSAYDEWSTEGLSLTVVLGKLESHTRATFASSVVLLQACVFAVKNTTCPLPTSRTIESRALRGRPPLSLPPTRRSARQLDMWRKYLIVDRMRDIFSSRTSTIVHRIHWFRRSF